jgi:hypothetical protein
MKAVRPSSKICAALAASAHDLNCLTSLSRPHCRYLTVAMDITAPLSLPLEASFDSYDLLYNAAQAYTKLAGYSFVTGKSERRKGRLLKVLHCKRG